MGSMGELGEWVELETHAEENELSFANDPDNEMLIHHIETVLKLSVTEGWNSKLGVEVLPRMGGGE